MTDTHWNALGRAVVGILIVGTLVAAWAQDRRQRALLASGRCIQIVEALYTPPPQAHTSCYGDGTSQSCSTWYTQPDPYLRTLWRCPDPDRDGRQVEFWRRTTEWVMW